MPSTPGSVAPTSEPASRPPRSGAEPTRKERFATTVLEYRAARELLRNLVRRDIKIQHRGTALGALWSLITPITTVAIYTFIFTVIMPASPVRDAGNVPFAVYLFVGLTIWNLMQNGAIGGTSSVVGAGYLLSKVYFRREILPLTSVLSAFVTFLWEFGVALIVVVVVVGIPSWHVVFVPLIVLVAMLLAFGIGLLLSTAAVFFRDVQHFIGIFMQMWFWGTPIIYSLNLLEHRPTFLNIVQLNPMTGVVVSLRNVLLMDAAPDWKLLGYGAVVGLVLVVVGFVVFRRNERLFAEMI
ncbi:ABC transporter permease [Cellulomonas sp. Y8]|uniref:ABC transporter permease n=1 Tax=Cellulomonas sp. Y8 TaxID=2591145 RepID=UPI00143CE40D|nr:ABC transporter permease [Cellulomonas sp. Y8]